MAVKQTMAFWENVRQRAPYYRKAMTSLLAPSERELEMLNADWANAQRLSLQPNRLFYTRSTDSVVLDLSMVREKLREKQKPVVTVAWMYPTGDSAASARVQAQVKEVIQQLRAAKIGFEEESAPGSHASIELKEKGRPLARLSLPLGASSLQGQQFAEQVITATVESDLQIEAQAREGDPSIRGMSLATAMANAILDRPRVQLAQSLLLLAKDRLCKTTVEEAIRVSAIGRRDAPPLAAKHDTLAQQSPATGATSATAKRDEALLLPRSCALFASRNEAPPTIQELKVAATLDITATLPRLVQQTAALVSAQPGQDAVRSSATKRLYGIIVGSGELAVQLRRHRSLGAALDAFLASPIAAALGVDATLKKDVALLRQALREVGAPPAAADSAVATLWRTQAVNGILQDDLVRRAELLLLLAAGQRTDSLAVPQNGKLLTSGQDAVGRYRVARRLVTRLLENGGRDPTRDALEAIFEELEAALESAYSGEVASAVRHGVDAIAMIRAFASDGRELVDRRAEWMRTLQLLANLVDAQTSDEARLAFNRFIGESEGFLAKRRGSVDFPRMKVNGYVGAGLAFGGFRGTTESSAIAVSLPVGFEIGIRRPLAWLDIDGAVPYLGLLIAPIDFGAFASLRVYHGEQESTRTELLEALAPSLLLSIGLTQSHPVSVLVGPQWRPATGQLPARRSLLLGLAVDVPLFP